MPNDAKPPWPRLNEADEAAASTAKPMSVVIGERMRSYREAESLRQDELARKARQHGLRWERATVAAIETGRRAISIEELVRLPLLLDRTLPEMFPAGPEWVSLGPDAAYSPDAVADVLSGGWGDTHPIDTPLTRDWRRAIVAAGWTTEAGRKATVAKVKAYESQMRALWPGATYADVIAAEQDADGEVCRRAAQKLGVEPVYLAAAARRAFERSLTDERDARAPEGVKSRGHITRALVAELVPLLEEAGALPPRRRRRRRETKGS